MSTGETKPVTPDTSSGNILTNLKNPQSIILIVMILLTGGTNFIKTSTVEDTSMTNQAEIAKAIKEIHEMHETQKTFLEEIKSRLELSTPAPTPK